MALTVKVPLKKSPPPPAKLGTARAVQPAAAPEGTLLMLRVADIAVASGQPRQNFDAAALAELTDSIRRLGVLQPLLVRPRFDPDEDRIVYTLVAGERRLRAATAAGIDLVPCLVRDLEDGERQLAQLAENVERVALDDIEIAQHYERLIDGGLTQAELAAAVGRDPSTISNQLRLLKLPEVWQRRLAAGELSRAHAIALLPYADLPPAVAAIEAEFARCGVPGLRDLPDLLRAELSQISRKMSPPEKYDTSGRMFKPTPEQLVELCVRDVRCWGDRIVPRAFNVELYDRLQAAAKQHSEQKSTAKAARKATAAVAQATTPAEKAAAKKAAAAAEKARQEKAAAALNKKLWRWITAWRQQRLLALAGASKIPDPLLGRFALVFGVADRRQGERLEEFAAALTGHNGKRRIDEEQFVAAVLAAPEKKFATAYREALTDWLAHPFAGHGTDLPPWAIAQFAAAAGIDLASEWRVTRDFLELHTTAQLLDLAAEWDLSQRPAKRLDLIDLLLSDPLQAVPRALREVQPVFLD